MKYEVIMRPIHLATAILLTAAIPAFAQSSGTPGGGITTSTQQTSGSVNGNGTSGAVQTGAAGNPALSGPALSGTGKTTVPPPGVTTGVPTTSNDQTTGGVKSGTSGTQKP
jgi:hypothetical protein